MNKLKKSYIAGRMNLHFVRFVLQFFKSSFKQKDKVLVKSCDGIGDILVRSRLAQRIIDKYGKDNVYFLMQEHYTKLGEMLGYNTIGYSRKERKKIFHRLKKMFDLNRMGFFKYINIEFGNDITVGNLFMEERVGKIDNHWMVCKNNKYYTKALAIEDLYVIDQISLMGKEIIDSKLTRDDFMPDLREIFEVSEEDIVIAVGSTEKTRVCSPKLMIEYIKTIIENFPDKKILLVGNGERQKKYADEIVSYFKSSNLENLVDKTSLKEVFEIVAKSFLFIGFESGLYNLCFALKKRGIILFKERSGVFIHEVPWLKIIFPNELKRVVEDNEYPGEGINSITPKEFEKELLKIREEEEI